MAPTLTAAERAAIELCRIARDTGSQTDFRTIAAAWRIDRERLQDLFYDLYVNPSLAQQTSRRAA